MSGLRLVLLALVLRPLRHEPLRTALTILGIAAGVAILVAIRLSNQSALRSFDEAVDAVAGRANWQITSDAGLMDERILLRLRPLWDHDARFAPVIDTDAVLLPAGVPVRLLAVDLMSDLHFRDYEYARIESNAGDEQIAAFLSLFSEGSIVLPVDFARHHGLVLGSTVQLESAGREAGFVLRGILEAEGPASALSESLVVVDLAVAQERLPHLRGRLTRVDLMIPTGSEPELLPFVRSLLEPGMRLERPSQRSARVDRMLRAFRVNLFALAGVALLVGIYLVYNTVLISILRRRQDVGVLKTVGVTPRQILAAFIAEGAIFGAVGGILGVGLGWLLARSILVFISRTVNALYVQSAPSEILLTPGIAAVGLLLGVGGAVLAALQPAWEASRVRPGALMRPGLYQRVQPKIAAGLAIGAAIAFVLAAVAASLPPIGRIPLFGYVAVLLLVAGFSLLSPSMLSRTSDALRRPFGRLLGVPGRIAAGSVAASLRRTAVATAALTLAIGMTVAVSVMVGSFRETVRIWVGQTVQSDLWLRPARGLDDAPRASFPAAIAEKLRGVDFIEAIDRVTMREIVWRDEVISLGGADFETARRFSAFPMIAPGSAAEALDDAMRRRGVLVSESLAIHHGLSVGDVITLPIPDGAARFPITGVYRDYSNDRGTVMLDRELYTRLWNDDSIHTVGVYLREGVDPDEAKRELEERFGSPYRLFAATNSAIRREVMRIFDQTFLITWSLLAISLLVAVMGIVNTLSALVIERRDELALLRVLGLTRSQIRTMIVAESAVIGIAATLLGAGAGWLMSLILIHVINRQSFGWTIATHPPWGMLAASLAIMFVVTTLAGIAPARLAERGRWRAAE